MIYCEMCGEARATYWFFPADDPDRPALLCASHARMAGPGDVDRLEGAPEHIATILERLWLAKPAQRRAG